MFAQTPTAAQILLHDPRGKKPCRIMSIPSDVIRLHNMKYLMFICVAKDVKLTHEQRATVGERSEGWAKEMDARGVRVTGHQLRPAAEAKSVRIRDDRLFVTDGPFAETREQIGGFDLLECSTMEEAIAVARKHPVAAFGTIEVRQLWED